VSTDLFQALTLGLLVIVILALLVAVSMLGKIRAMLERGGAAPRAGERAPEPAVRVDETAAELDVDEVEPAGAVDAPSDATPEPAEDDAVDSERPFERAGRWYFRRAGELLVYEEGTGEWVPATATTEAAEGVDRHLQTVEASAEPAEAVQSHADAVAASTEPAVAEGDAPSVEEATSGERATEPSTSFAGQPLATAEEDAARIEVADETTDTSAGAAFEESGDAGVSMDDVPEEVAPRPSESFWRCESCGAVNGSTAATCRMCFTPRP
jgi:hypothetical protein